MSQKLALSQLKSLQESKEQPNGDNEIRKTIRKKRRSAKKQQQQQRQQAAKQQQISKLDYYKATTTTQKSTAELMSKVCAFRVMTTPSCGVSGQLSFTVGGVTSCMQLLGQPLPKEDSDSDLDSDLDL